MRFGLSIKRIQEASVCVGLFSFIEDTQPEIVALKFILCRLTMELPRGGGTLHLATPHLSSNIPAHHTTHPSEGGLFLAMWQYLLLPAVWRLWFCE